jgi:glycosyltransferase involved in cell wall biosynthesis
MNKNIHDQYEKYISILKKSHIFLLPTKAECSAIVFCEASAFGIPILTYLTGGLDDYVVDGVNGYKLHLGASSMEFADTIQHCIENNELVKLSSGGKRLYAERLSWKAWSQRFKDLMQDTFNYEI